MSTGHCPLFGARFLPMRLCTAGCNASLNSIERHALPFNLMCNDWQDASVKSITFYSFVVPIFPINIENRAYLSPKMVLFKKQKKNDCFLFSNKQYLFAFIL